MEDMNHPTGKDRSTARELLLWFIATGIATLISTLGVHFIAQYTKFGHLKVVVATFAIALMSLTWGSWSSLLWVRRGSLRKIIAISTYSPSLWMIAIGGALYWFGVLTLPIILMLIGGGVSLAIVSNRLTRTVRCLDLKESPRFPLLVSLLHTLMCAFAVSGFLYLWVGEVVPSIRCPYVMAHLLSDPQTVIAGLPDFAAIATHFTWKSILAVSLISTVIPALMSEFLSRVVISKRTLK